MKGVYVWFWNFLPYPFSIPVYQMDTQSKFQIKQWLVCKNTQPEWEVLSNKLQLKFFHENWTCIRTHISTFSIIVGLAQT